MWLVVRSELLAALRELDLDGMTLRQAQASVEGWRRPLVAAALRHLIWSGVFTVDLDTVLSGGHVLRRSA